MCEGKAMVLGVKEIAALCEREELTICGFLEGCHNCFQVRFDKLERKMKCESGRDYPPLDEVQRACHFLEVVGPPIKTPKYSSYSLKHDAEALFRKCGRGNPYVSNGALLVAAYYLGFPVKRNKSMWQLNGLVGVSTRRLDVIGKRNIE